MLLHCKLERARTPRIRPGLDLVMDPDVLAKHCRLRLTYRHFAITVILVRQTVGNLMFLLFAQQAGLAGEKWSIWVSVYHSTARWLCRLEKNPPTTSLSPRLKFVKDIQKHWLGSVPWETVLTVNQELCRAHNTSHQEKSDVCEAVRELWEKSASKAMSLSEVLDVCRCCQDLGPFVFNNGNTFAAISKSLVEDWIESLPPVEGQILRTTVGHYVAGQIKKRELLQVLRHAETRWQVPGARPTAHVAPKKSQAEAAPSLMRTHPAPH